MTNQWAKTMQEILDAIDHAIRMRESENFTLSALANSLGYSEYHLSRRFKIIAGMSFREFFRLRKLAFAMEELTGSKESILNIALKYGFSSHEAFTLAFRATYGLTPSAYRKLTQKNNAPVPFESFIPERVAKETLALMED